MPKDELKTSCKPKPRWYNRRDTICTIRRPSEHKYYYSTELCCFLNSLGLHFNPFKQPGGIYIKLCLIISMCFGVVDIKRLNCRLGTARAYCDTSKLVGNKLEPFRRSGRDERVVIQLGIKAQADGVDERATYSYWILIGISHHLGHDKWKMLQCDLPVMTGDSVHQYALMTLDHIATMNNRAGLCVGALLPVVFSMDFEMTCDEERSRVLDLLASQEPRCFDLTQHFRQTLLHAPGAFGKPPSPLSIMSVID
jgi:hypothetical protein